MNMNNHEKPPTLVEFFRTARTLDWIWYMADSYAAYTRGNKAEAELKALAARLGPAYQRVYNTVEVAVRTRPDSLLTDVHVAFPAAGLDGNLLHGLRRCIYGGIQPAEAAELLRQMEGQLIEGGGAS